jgi:hypothetical protein
VLLLNAAGKITCFAIDKIGCALNGEADIMRDVGYSNDSNTDYDSVT